MNLQPHQLLQRHPVDDGVGAWPGAANHLRRHLHLDQHLTNSGSTWSNSPATGNKTATLSVPLTESRIGNIYRCQITDAEGTVVYSEPAALNLLTESWTNTYNADGLRTKRTNGPTTYNYIYNGSSLSQMTVDGNTLYFAYDASGTPMSVKYNGTTYYYTVNLLGDVTGIINQSGNQIVGYTYDAWGNLLSITGSSANTLGKYNPLRYRGYVYDTETQFYYLQSRYYDPKIGRFILHDGTMFQAYWFEDSSL